MGHLVKSDMLVEEFYELLNYYDSSNYLPLMPRVHNNGLEYNFNNKKYFIPSNKSCVYEILNKKELRKLKLRMLNREQ